MIIPILLSLAQPGTANPAWQIFTLAKQASDDISKNHISLSPPLDAPIIIKKLQTHYLGDKYIARNSTMQMIFIPTINKDIIGFDISVEVLTVETEGDKDLSRLLNNTHNKSSTISKFTYDVANDVLILNNGDELWQEFLIDVQNVRINAGARDKDQQKKDKLLFDKIANIPAPVRDGIFSEDMAILLSFIGKPRASYDHQINGDNIIISQQQELQNGKIRENTKFSISRHSGLVNHMTRTSQSTIEGARKVVTIMETITP